MGENARDPVLSILADGALRNPKSKIGHPDISLAWPTYVAVSDTHAYVNDTLNRRVVKVRLDWKVEESLLLKCADPPTWDDPQWWIFRPDLAKAVSVVGR